MAQQAVVPRGSRVVVGEAGTLACSRSPANQLVMNRMKLALEMRVIAAQRKRGGQT
jgi:hypothetical protein